MCDNNQCGNYDHEEDNISCSSSSSSSCSSYSVPRCEKPAEHQRKCVEVEYEVCERNCDKVPVLLEQKLYIPRLCGVEVVKDCHGCARKLCTDVRGWTLCSVGSCIIEGRLEQKVLGPHFKPCRPSCESSEGGSGAFYVGKNTGNHRNNNNGGMVVETRRVNRGGAGKKNKKKAKRASPNKKTAKKHKH